MTVICVTVTQSNQQVVSGIPRTVSITTNIPATIFYTLDGTVPTLFSTMYTGPISLPYNSLSVVLKILATNGVNSSPIITECYQTDIVDSNARLPHASTNAQAGSIIPDAYPFGTPPYQPNQIFLNPADSGVTVDNEKKPSAPTAFNADGYGTAFTNQPYNTLNYQIVYTDKDAEGEQGPNIGNMPGITKVIYPPGPNANETSNQFTSTFDPKAFVIFQNFSQEDPNDPPQINRNFFTLEDPETARDGNYFFNAGQDTPSPSGSFVRAHYNPRTGEITHYYHDSWTNKWIISTSPYQPNHSANNDLAAAVMGRNSHVFEWVAFQRRVLF